MFAVAKYLLLSYTQGPLERKLVTHSSILAWKNPVNRGVWQSTVLGVAKVRLDGAHMHDGGHKR